MRNRLVYRVVAKQRVDYLLLAAERCLPQRCVATSAVLLGLGGFGTARHGTTRHGENIAFLIVA
jgi:hypothetical protein